MSEESGFSYEKASIYRGWSSYAASIMLVIVSIFQLISIGDAPSLRTLIITAYFIAIGIIIICVEMETGNTNQWFLFLNFGWGKVYLYVFVVVSMLSFPVISWIQWVIAILFLVSAGFNLFIGRKFANEEFERVKGIIERI